MRLFVVAAVLATSGSYGMLASTTANAAINRDEVAMHGQIIDTYDNQPIPSAWVYMGCGEGGGAVVQADANGDYTFTKGQIYDSVDRECAFAMGIGMQAQHDDYGWGSEEWSEDRTGEGDEEWEDWINRNFTGQYFDFHLDGDGSQIKTVPAGFSSADDKTVESGRTVAVTDLQVTGTGDAAIDVTLKADGDGTIDFTTVEDVTISGRGTGYVMLTGSRTAINAVLATMQYTAGSAGDVVITAELGNNVGDVLWNDGEDGNGHAYIVVRSSMTWHQAEVAAQTYTFGGQTGYLATITSAQENAFIYNNLPTANRTGWLGANDEAVEGTWRWQTGPETGDVLSYTNWNENEPNNQSNEDCMQFVTGGRWNDVTCSTPRPFVVEFGGASLPQPVRTQFTITATPSVSEDGNGDGIPDDTQDTVINLTDPTTDRTVTLELDPSCTVESATMLRVSDLAVKDSAYKYTTGFVNFMATGCDDDKTTVTLYYHGTSLDGLTVRKHNPNKNSYFTISEALLTKRVIAGQDVAVVSYEVVDGGSLDIDGQQNGTIIDPVGIGILEVGVPNTGFGRER